MSLKLISFYLNKRYMVVIIDNDIVFLIYLKYWGEINFSKFSGNLRICNCLFCYNIISSCLLLTKSFELKVLILKEISIIHVHMYFPLLSCRNVSSFFFNYFFKLFATLWESKELPIMIIVFHQWSGTDKGRV